VGVVRSSYRCNAAAFCLHNDERDKYAGLATAETLRASKQASDAYRLAFRSTVASKSFASMTQ
jgi:hypothetical protein